MSTNQKTQNRIMGEYSISKSYKGILRIAHIIDLIQGDEDRFLNPTYYGTPTELVNISGGTYNSIQKGVQTAEHSLKGTQTIKRYNIPDDELRNRRVPMTDSMGNFLNWWVGADGVTIGSNELINDSYIGYDIFIQKQFDKYPIYQEKYFPVLKTTQFIVGKEKQKYSTEKTKITVLSESHPTVNIQGQSPKLIIENLYEKENYKPYVGDDGIHRDYTPAYRTDINGEIQEVKLHNYNLAVGDGKKYKKLRTIFNDTKHTVQDFDTFMYRQNDWDYDNYRAGQKWVNAGWDTDTETTQKFKVTTTGNFENSAKYNKKIANYPDNTIYKTGDVLDCKVDVVNLRDYVVDVVKKFTQDNIVEVPSGTVIWQYCSLNKWRAYGDSGIGDDISDFSYPGHRPILQNRQDANAEDQGNKNLFYNSTLQGASKKINHIRKRSVSSNEKSKTDTASSSVKYKDADNFYDELIPLYKRDYVLCDGSKYRIPFYPKFTNSNLGSLSEHKDRFLELFFNLGYRYTDRKKMLKRPRTSFDSKTGEIFLLNSDGKKIKYLATSDDSVSVSQVIQPNISYNILINTPPYDLWQGNGAPSFSHMPQNFEKLQDTDVLFGEDLATIVAVTMIYDHYISIYEPGNEPTYNEIRQWCINSNEDNVSLGQSFPESYIFNSFIGDDNSDMEKYWKKSFKYGEKTCPKTMQVTYTDKDNQVYTLNIGREVNNLNSYIKYYDAEAEVIRIVRVYDLPMVHYFINLLASSHNRENNLRKYCYTYYNYDFQVPSLLSQDGSPSFIGSSGYSESDENRVKLKTVVQWFTRYSHSTRPHRHALFYGKSIMNDLNSSEVPAHYSGSSITGNNSSPVNIAGFYGGTRFNFPSFDRKGNTPIQSREITERYGNYIINQYYLETDTVDINGMKVNVLINSGINSNVAGSVQRNRYGWKTGAYRILTRDTKTKGQINEAHKKAYTQEKFDFSSTINQQDIDDYWTYNKPAWYSLLPKEDPRYDTSEPNRGISSSPIPTTHSAIISYHKITENAKGYKPYNDTKKANLGFFSPEHITMLPLIKI